MTIRNTLRVDPIHRGIAGRLGECGIQPMVMQVLQPSSNKKSFGDPSLFYVRTVTVQSDSLGGVYIFLVLLRAANFLDCTADRANPNCHDL